MVAGMQHTPLPPADRRGSQTGPSASRPRMHLDLSGSSDKFPPPATWRRGAMTERDESVSREMLELRRVVAENKKWQERCERLETERNDARLQAKTSAEELAACMDRWEEREQLMLEQQQTIAELQSQLSDALQSSVSEMAGLPQNVSRSSMVSSQSNEVRGAVQEEHSSHELHHFLRYRRTIAQQSRKFEKLDVPVLSLTPRQMSTTSFGSHMSERFAFQAGQVLKQQIRNMQKNDFDKNNRLFGSIDLFVQVKLKEIAQETELAPVPNATRLAVACDLMDKLTATSSVHYVALSSLRQEMLAAIFEGYSVNSAAEQKRRLPRVQDKLLLNAVRPLAEDYSSHTPYFVQVARLKKALAEAQTELNTALMQSSNKLRRLQLVCNCVTRMADDALALLLRSSFSAWASVPVLQLRRGELCARSRRPQARTAFVLRTMFAWFRSVVLEKSDVFRRHVERESKKAEIFKAEATARAKEAVVAKSSKQDLAVELLAWRGFAVQLARTVLGDSRRLVEAMCLGNVKDARMLLDATEREQAGVFVAGLHDAPAEEFLLRWLRHSTEGRITSFGPECVSPETLKALTSDPSATASDAAGQTLSRPGSRDASREWLRSAAASPAVGAGGGVHAPREIGTPPHAHGGGTPLGSTPKRPLQGGHYASGGGTGSPRRRGREGAGGVVEEILQEMNRRTVQARAVTKAQLRDGEDDAPRVELLCHLFPRARNVRHTRGAQLAEELTALEAAFRKLEAANALYIDGMDPICKAIVQFHRKVNMEYEEMVRSLSMLQAGEHRVEELRRHFETRIVFGFAEKIKFRSPEEIDSDIHLRNQRIMTLHSHKRRDSVEEDGAVLNAAKKRLVAFSYVDAVPDVLANE